MSANPTPANAGIAITGMAGRFPGASTSAQLWENVWAGVRSIETFCEADLRARDVDAATLANSNYVRAGSVLESFDKFDASFFGYTPREAEIMDPQHRLM